MKQMKPPILLIPGKMKEMNEYLLERTGCFAFLVSDSTWKYSEPKTGQGAVELWAVALYTIYHDYGCRYIDFILDEDNLPSQSLHGDLKKCRKHVRMVQRVLRPNIAHGTLDVYTAERLMKTLFPQESGTIDQISEDQWFQAAEQLRESSDFLADTMKKWADAYKNEKNPGIPVRTLKKDFGESKFFSKSIDARVVFDTLDRDFGKKRARTILLEKHENQDPNIIETKLRQWRDEIKAEFLSDKINCPDQIIGKLKGYLHEIHYPRPVASIDAAEECGLSLPGF